MRLEVRRVSRAAALALMTAWTTEALLAQGPEEVVLRDRAAVREAKATGGGGGTCAPGGSSSASNCPSWGGFIKPMPGTICTMNVGNNNPTSLYTNKIRNCTEATERRDGVASSGCDVINIIELNSDEQCYCACNPANLCKVWGAPGVCLMDDPGRPAICKTHHHGYYEPDRCELCKGCSGTAKPATCQTQAEIICDPRQYYPPVCKQEPSKGCDCMCFRKGQCSPGGSGSCRDQDIPPVPGCDTGNYAKCRKCDFDGDGSFDWGSCVAHPPHCNQDPNRDRATCLQACSTPIMESAAQFLADAKVRTLSGDLNCDPEGPCSVFGQCPWVGLMESYGLKICHYDTGTTSNDACAIDLVLSNSCGCSSQTNVAAPGDHATIVYSSTPGYWTGPLTQIVSANSASTCSDPDATDPLLDRLGASASCPTTENGQPLGSCSSWGLTMTADVRYYTRVDGCYLQPEMGMPKVLVCDVATASASATCTNAASSGSRVSVTIGKATAMTASSCSNGTQYNPSARVVAAMPEVVTPSLVYRSDGNLYFRVERDARRDRTADCNATLPQGCTQPIDPVGTTLKAILDACPAEPADIN